MTDTTARTATREAHARYRITAAIRTLRRIHPDGFTANAVAHLAEQPRTACQTQLADQVRRGLLDIIGPDKYATGRKSSMFDHPTNPKAPA